MKTVTFDERSWQLVAINPANAVIDRAIELVPGLCGGQPDMRALWAAVLEVSPESPPADEWWHKETLRHLPFVLQVYDDALDKAREGRHFDNPCKVGSLEFLAWILGTQRGEELGPANDVQDQRDAERYRWLRDLNGVDGSGVEIFINDEAHGPGHLTAQIDAARAAKGQA